jgi:hypothetical protein
MNKIIAILLILLQFNCAENPNKNVPKTPPQYNADSSKKEVKFYSDAALKQLWDSLCRKKGCLTGGQYVYQGKFGGEGCAFSIDKQWKDFLYNTNKEQLATFLITQIPDKKETKTHACPFSLAKKGELAIYCLQGLFLVNFHELTPELEVSNKKNIYTQKWIWQMQKSKKEIKLLQALWRGKLNAE